MTGLTRLLELALLQSGPYSCYEGGPDPGCIVDPFTSAMGPTFVLFVIVIFGGGMAVYARSVAPVAVTAVIVGAAAVGVIPALGTQLIMMLAIAAAAAALFAMYNNFRQ